MPNFLDYHASYSRYSRAEKLEGTPFLYGKAEKSISVMQKGQQTLSIHYKHYTIDEEKDRISSDFSWWKASRNEVAQILFGSNGNVIFIDGRSPQDIERDIENEIKTRKELEKRRMEHEAAEKARQEDKKARQEDRWKSLGRCTRCGGKFSMFKKICKSCGKQKDY